MVIIENLVSNKSNINRKKTTKLKFRALAHRQSELAPNVSFVYGSKLSCFTCPPPHGTTAGVTAFLQTDQFLAFLSFVERKAVPVQ